MSQLRRIRRTLKTTGFGFDHVCDYGFSDEQIQFSVIVSESKTGKEFLVSIEKGKELLVSYRIRGEGVYTPTFARSVHELIFDSLKNRFSSGESNEVREALVGYDFGESFSYFLNFKQFEDVRIEKVA